MNKTCYNHKKHLIIIKNEIKEDISFFQFDWYKIHITFKNNSQRYSYISKRITILKNPKIKEISDNLFYYKDNLLSDIDQVLDFWWGYYRIFMKNWSIISSGSIKIVKNIIEQKEIKEVLEYLRKILDSKNNDEISQYLKKEFGKLHFISPDSVLSNFLSKTYKEKDDIFWKEKLIYPFDFNLSQKKALENIYSSNISVIQWPPWTWKTQTILNIIANLAVMQSKSVGIVSNNNSAIENVQEKLQKENYGFFTALLWNKENKETFFNNIPEIEKFDTQNSDDYISKLEEISVLMELDNTKQQLKTKLSDYELEQKHFEEYYLKQNIQTSFELPRFVKNSDSLMWFMVENTHQSKMRKKKGFLFKLRMFLKYGFVEFKKINTDEINLILSYQRAYYKFKIFELKNEISQIDEKLVGKNYSNLLWEYKKYSKILFQNKLNKKFNQEKTLFTINNYKYVFWDFIKRFPVILSSTYAIVNTLPRGYLLDYLIIDESSQVDLITWILAFSCCKNVIIVWDTKQLPHIANGGKVENTSIDECFNYYKHNILSSVLDVYQENIPIVLLREHYRCHPKIINFCNQKYYNWELIIYTKDTHDDSPLTIYRSVEGNHMRSIDIDKNNGKYNQRELDIIEHILREEFHSHKTLEHVGIITPFRKQVEKANEKFNNSFEVNTVHKFQWREKDTIIISTVLDNTKIWHEAIGFVDQPSLINVAVSRAKNKLVIVTDNQLFFQNWSELKDLMKYIQYSTLDKNIVQSDIVWAFDLLYKNYSDQLTLKENELIKVSEFKSENIWNTLITNILSQKRFENLSFAREIFLKNLISNPHKLNQEEIDFLQNNSRVDFLIYSNFGKQPVLVIEVDWVEYHENNSKQILRDKLKNNILEKYNIPYLRLKTNWSWEEQKIISQLESFI